MEGNKIYLGCIADDFTGAGDAASFLVQAGLSTILYNGLPAHLPEETSEAIVIALKTRSCPVQQAIRETIRAAKWLKQAGVEQLYLKYCSTFDSTREGNIGPVLDEILDYFNAPYTVLCPALPVNGRTVKDGKLYVNGVPLHESSMRNHPLNPMWDDRIKVLMEAQSKYPAIPISLLQMEQSSEEELESFIQEASRGKEHAYLIPDYYEEEHGELIVARFGKLPVLSGGSGLLTALAGSYPSRERMERIKQVERTAEESILILSGSCSEMTLKQIQSYLERGGKAYKIQPEALMSGRQMKEELLSQIDQAGKQPLLLYSSAPVGERTDGLALEPVAAMLEHLMAELSVYAVERGVRNLIVAGGETSGAVTKALKYDAYQIGKSIAPGVPVMIPLEKPEMRLVLKSGNFGQPDFFLKAQEILALGRK